MAVNNPVEYYEKMGFIGVDQMIYTVALLGMVAGLAGTAKAGWSNIVDKQPASWVPFLALAVGSTWAAGTGLKQANES